MFTKLLKYDFDAVWKYWWIVALCSLPLSIFTGIGIRILSQDISTLHDSIVAFLITGLFLSFMGIFFQPFLTYILVLIRFYKNFFTDEGYLTFTLPVKKTTLLNSKLVTTIIFEILSVIIIFVNMIIIVLIAGDVWNVSTTPSEPLPPFYFYLLIDAILWIGIAIVVTGISILFIFICITCGAMIAKKHKILCSVAIYYGANMVVSLISQIFLFSGFWGVMGYLDAIAPEASSLVTTFLLLAFLSIFVMVFAGLYLLELYFLDKRLNLE